MKTVLRLRLHAMQSQPRFPAASNVLAIPGGNSIFMATPTERITAGTAYRLFLLSSPLVVSFEQKSAWILMWYL